jgi:hypothetical protein
MVTGVESSLLVLCHRAVAPPFRRVPQSSHVKAYKASVALSHRRRPGSRRVRGG